MTRLKLKSDNFKSSNNFFNNFFHIYIKISKNLSAKYCQENKKKTTKKACERHQIFLKKKKKNSSNMLANFKKSLKR